ncbi:cupin domain-containing protein [Rivularia sp. UHCC 0363]|uniref:cupin domain-containing protein n=1 Tax=Rivularia sp. UHCC 0363 TaxID=3110244 RepID=UPI002B2160A4|nr:cupin domain-containing protein [Rivularia sp. UHCC 0363]MEA5593626.1 cupin domain-containing protein [Rivularia sp. UHCC 0363]
MIINPEEVPIQQSTNYPEEFKSIVAGRFRQRLGNFAGLKNFGVNLVKLSPGSASALRHWHSHEDEFIYVLEGELTIITDTGEEFLTSGMAAGFPANEANGHHLVNRSEQVAVYLEIGDRVDNDTVYYPDNDLIAKPGDGKSIFTRKDGTSHG